MMMLSLLLAHVVLLLWLPTSTHGQGRAITPSTNTMFFSNNAIKYKWDWTFPNIEMNIVVNTSNIAGNDDEVLAIAFAILPSTTSGYSNGENGLASAGWMKLGRVFWMLIEENGGTLSVPEPFLTKEFCTTKGECTPLTGKGQGLFFTRLPANAGPNQQCSVDSFSDVTLVQNGEITKVTFSFPGDAFANCGGSTNSLYNIEDNLAQGAPVYGVFAAFTATDRPANGVSNMLFNGNLVKHTVAWTRSDPRSIQFTEVSPTPEPTPQPTQEPTTVEQRLACPDLEKQKECERVNTMWGYVKNRRRRNSRIAYKCRNTPGCFACYQGRSSPIDQQICRVKIKDGGGQNPRSGVCAGRTSPFLPDASLGCPRMINCPGPQVILRCRQCNTDFQDVLQRKRCCEGDMNGRQISSGACLFHKGVCRALGNKNNDETNIILLRHMPGYFDNCPTS